MKIIVRHLLLVLVAFALCVACILSADGVSKLNGLQIQDGAITNAHIAGGANIAASKLDSTLATKSYVDGVAQGAPIGTIILHAGATPTGYLYCDGATYDGTSATYSALYSVIQNQFGGNTPAAFKVPDFRGRLPVGIGTGTGLSQRQMGDKGGEQSHVLTVAEMPSHTHGIDYVGSYGGGYGWLDGTSAQSSGFKSTQANGGNGAHNTMPPFLVVRYCIKY